MTWRRCPIHPEHALVDATCLDTGERVTLRVPWAHRATSIGWHDAGRATWKAADGTPKVGRLCAEDEGGCTAEDEDGEMHHLPRGVYSTWAPNVGVLAKGARWIMALLKADDSAALKPGERWITVHPNGPGSKGVPVLITPAGDGTHKIIGGAGGKLTHLRLHNVGSPEEHAAARKRKDEERRGKARASKAEEAERRAKMTPEERKEAEADDAEKAATKREVEQKKRMHERRHIETVRSTLGGVDDDLDQEELRKLPEAVANLKRSRHHRTQLAQANRRVREALERVADARADQAQAAAVVERTLAEAPEDHEHGTQQALDELHLQRQEDEERRAARVENRLRKTGGKTGVGDAATETAAAALDSIDPKALEARLKVSGGRSDAEDFQVGDSASGELRRRAVQHQQEALILHTLAKGEDATAIAPKEVVDSVAETALRRARVDREEDPEAAREALRQEAARRVRRAELMEVHADELLQVEVEKGPDVAMRRLVSRDTRARVVESAATAEKLGLTKPETTPLREADLAALEAVTASAAELRAARKQLAAMEKAINTNRFDRSRRAFDLHVEAAPDEVVQTAHDAMLTELTRRLEGAASPRRTAFQQSLGTGHHNALADVSLGLTGQSYLDRPTVDALGPKNAAHLLRWAMEEHGGISPQAALEAIETHHVAEVERRSAAALAEAEAYQPDLVASATTPDDLEHALASLDMHEHNLDQAQRAIGAAIGNLEGTATLAQAFRGPPPEHLAMQVPDGDFNGALTWAHAVGLRPGDYVIDRAKKEVRIPRASWARLIQRDDPAELEARKTAEAIKRGDHDEAGYLPEGFTSRTKSSFTDPVPDRPRFFRPLVLKGEGDEVRGGLRDHVASRLAEGEPADLIHRDLTSSMAMTRVGDGQRDAYMDELDRLFPRWATDTPDVPHPDSLQAGDLAEHVRAVEEHLGALHAGHPGQPEKLPAIRAAVEALEQRAQALPGAAPELHRRAAERVGLLRRAVDGENVAGLAVPDWGKRKSAGYHEAHHRELVADWMRRTYGDEVAPLHAQALDLDHPGTQDAVYRALADEPGAKHAFVPTAELDDDGRRHLRQTYYQTAGIGDSKSWDEPYRHALEGGEGWTPERDERGEITNEPLTEKYKRKGGTGPHGEPPRTITGTASMFGGGMFGSGGDDEGPINPDWEAWSKDAKTLGRAYPRQGHDLYLAAMGPRPKPQPWDGMTDTARTAAAEIIASNPQHTAEDVARDLVAQGHVEPRYRARAQAHVAGDVWDNERRLAEQRKATADTPWSAFVTTMGGQEAAYKAMQDHLRGRFAERFSEHYGRLTGRPLLTGYANHDARQQFIMGTASPSQQAKLMAELRAEDDRARQRAGTGRFSDMGGAGSIVRQRASSAEATAARAQDQGSLFGSGPATPPADPGGLFGGLFGSPPPATSPTPPRDPHTAHHVVVGSVGDKLALHYDPDLAARDPEGAARASEAKATRHVGALRDMSVIGRSDDPERELRYRAGRAGFKPEAVATAMESAGKLAAGATPAEHAAVAYAVLCRTQPGGRRVEVPHQLDDVRRVVATDPKEIRTEAVSFDPTRATHGAAGWTVAASDAKPPPAAPPLVQRGERGQRTTIGQRAEEQVASVIGRFAHQFDPNRPSTLWGGVNMDGDRIHQQRVIRQIGTVKRVGVYMGVGSGKTAMMLGGFTSEHAKGETPKAAMLVPAAVQDQFGGEARQFLDPGRYRWTAGSDLDNHEARVEALRNPDNHLTFLTHQTARDTVVRMMAEHFQREPDELMQDFMRLDDATRAEWVAQAREAHGVPRMFIGIDEAHNVTSRSEGSESRTAAVLHALAHPKNATHLVAATGSPHKNDEGEVYSLARMLRPDRYADRVRFMQSWGQDLEHNPDAIRRELSPYTYSHRITPEGVDRMDGSNPEVRDGRVVATDAPLPLHPHQQAQVEAADRAYEALQKARREGRVDIAAARALSPSSFEGQPEERHEEIARGVVTAAGTMREAAHRRAINGAPPGSNTKLDRMLDVVEHELRHGEWRHLDGTTRKGKPSVIFTDRATEAHMIRDALQKRGIRSDVYHGGLTADERERVRRGFEPGRGRESEATTDVLVLTPSGEAGLNLQRAKATHHYDVPMTAKSWTQRTGRAYRQGQVGDVTTYDWHTDTEHERRARTRLQRKRGLADVFESPIGALDEHGVAAEYRRALAAQHEARDPDHVSDASLHTLASA